MTGRALACLAAAAFALQIPRLGQAQSGAERQQAPDAKTVAELTSALHRGRDIEITEALLEDFETGLRTELRLWEEFTAQFAAHQKAQEQYRACERQVATSPERQQILLKVGATAPDNATVEQAQRIGEKLQAELAALLQRKCGSPIEEQWPYEKRRQLMIEIEQAGAAAFDAAQAARAARAPGSRGPAAGDDFWGNSPAPSDLYYLLKDRIVPFCEAWKQKLIIIDNQDGKFKFSFSSTVPLSLLYTQAEVSAQLSFCTGSTSLAMLYQFHEFDFDRKYLPPLPPSRPSRRP